MNFKIEKLKEHIDYKWRVQSSNQWECTCVAYIDARDVQDMLDSVCGPENWQSKYQGVDGKLFCSIGIKIGEEWVWKTDCGTESNIEKEKGQSSDAFKRAAVSWGIGRFLYSLEVRKIKEVIEKKGKFYPAQNGQQIWDVNAYFANNAPVDPSEQEYEKLSTRADTLEKWRKLGEWLVKKKASPELCKRYNQEMELWEQAKKEGDSQPGFAEGVKVGRNT
jgi:hypothetical protein